MVYGVHSFEKITKNLKNRHFLPKIFQSANFGTYARVDKTYLHFFFQVDPVIYILKSKTWASQENRRKFIGSAHENTFLHQ